MQILDLHNHREFVPLLAEWHAAQWRNYPPDREALLLARSSEAGLPKTFFALHNGSPIGFVCLLSSNVPSRQDLTPWLASLYVVPEHRNKRVGQRLVEHCLIHTSMLGYERLYLFTSSAIAYYTKMGWCEVGTVSIFGKLETILSTIC